MGSRSVLAGLGCQSIPQRSAAFLIIKIKRELTPQIVELPGSAVLVDHQVLIELEGCESDGHLGNDACCHSSETLVQRQGRFLLDNPHPDAQECKFTALDIIHCINNQGTIS